MFRHLLALPAIWTVLAGCLTSPVSAAPPLAERLLPPTTKGFLAVPDVESLRQNWEKTQLGQFVNDPVMAPFIEDVKRQIRTKVSKTDSALGITWEDLVGVYSGEVCIAVVQPWDAQLEDQAWIAAVEKDVAAAENRGASEEQIAEIKKLSTKSSQEDLQRRRAARRGMVLLVDITGNREAAEELLKKVANGLKQRGATAKKETIAGISVITHQVPIEGDRVGGVRNVYYCIHDDQLIATDNQAAAEEVLSRLAGAEERASLADSAAFVAAMEGARPADDDSVPDLRWFIEPFGYIEVSRAYDGGRRRRGTDLLRVLANQGFDAVQGIGGHIQFSTEDHEVLHRSFVYALAVEHPVDSVNTEKYRLAANILNFVNKPSDRPAEWVPGPLSTYLTFNWKIKEAFEYVGNLVDEIAGDKVFEDVLRGIEKDPNGPRIDIRNDLIRHLAERVTIVSDYDSPITTKSERLLLGIEVSDAVAVVKAVTKAMESDPHAQKREHNDHVVWEILDDAPVEIETIKIDGGFGFGFEDVEPVPEENEKPLIPNAAVTVAYGQLLVANNIDYLFEILDLPTSDRQQLDTQRLDAMTDYTRVGEALEQLGLDEASFRFFTRTDEAYRPTYELTRRGKMPESETILGKLLNQIWAPDEEGQRRQQYIDGEKMPEYSQILKYFGPAGVFVRTEDDGWSIVGCLLTK